MDRAEDRRIAELLMARDENALRDVMSRHGGAVYGMARRIVAEPSLAEEVAQDVFVALWRRPGAYDPDRGGLRAFLQGMARNKAIDVVRREEALKRAKEALMSEAEASGEATVSEPTAAVDQRQGVADALAKLSPVQREALVLAYFGGRTYRQVAAELGIPEGTAKTRLRDGLMKLRELMSAPERTSDG